MDLVDIDKVLDDFELNEGNKQLQENSSKHVNEEENNQSTSTGINSTAGLLSKVPAAHESQHNNNESGKPVTKVNVSNVFSSLNDYVNAELDINFEKLNFNKPAPYNDESMETPLLLPEDDEKNEKFQVDTSNSTTDSLKIETSPKSDQKQTTHLSSSFSESTTPTSSQGSSSRQSTPTNSTTEDDENREPKENVSDKLGGDDANKLLCSNENVSSMATDDIRTSSNRKDIKSSTIFSSSSSYCYNENNSTDVTFSNDIVSLNETSSLSSLANISNNEERGVLGTLVQPNNDEQTNSDELTTTTSELNTTKNDIDIETIDRSSVLAKDKNEVISNDKEKVEVVEENNVENEINYKPVVGFESTMDDVSDTELESYLQELEFETNNVIHASTPAVTHPNIEEEMANELEDRNSRGNAIVESKVAEDNSTTENHKDEKNVDNISQASTVECNEVVPHTDLDEKILPPVKQIDEPAAEGGQHENPVVIAVEEGTASQAENLVEEKELKESSIGEENTVTASSSSSHLIRPNTLNFPSAVDDDVPPAEETPPPPSQEPGYSSSSSDEVVNAPNVEESIDNEEYSSSGSQLRDNLGRVPPFWVPDSEYKNCMHCALKFSMIKRRHHCRACGKVLCSSCCSMKAKIEYLGDVEARVCHQCDIILNSRSDQQGDEAGAVGGDAALIDESGGAIRSPNPNNPMEYCSRLPPHQQVAQAQQTGTPISVLVPVGVLKREGQKSARKEKNVIFSDGIRPGCDLTELDHNWDSKSSSGSYGRRSGSKRVQTPPGTSATKTFRNIKLPKVDESNNSYIPKEENGIPPLYVASKTDFQFMDVVNNAELIARLHQEELKFSIQRNFFVHVKIVKLSCCINRSVINFTTQGLRYVGQDEIVILLVLDESNTIPKDIFLHLNEIYQNADEGQTITELGYSLPRTQNFLGSKEHGGFLYIRQTFQCLQGVNVPESPYLIGILIHRWELPWAKIFPLRLMLRLGALYRYYPSPHISERGRSSVYAEIAQTVINFLADFRTFSYTIPTIRGMTIHMEDRKIVMQIPRNRYDQVVKAIANSSDHILAMSGVFSKKADGHLVCIQNTESGCPEMYQYSTQAINIEGQPRKVTGTSFVILNGALKTSSGLSGKCTVVEDGLMVQILPQTMIAVREALKNIKDYNIVCGPTNATAEQTETVSIVWGDNDLEFNMGVVSPIDGKELHGIPSIRVHKGLEYSNANHLFRWTEVFIIKSDEDSPHGRDQIDISKISEKIARSTATALVSFLDLLAANGLTQLGLRVTLDPENVCYEAGSQQNKLPPLYMNVLDNELIQTLHRHASNLQTDTSIILELIFNILDK